MKAGNSRSQATAVRQRWHIASIPAAAASLAEALNIPPIVAQILANRGYADPQAAQQFLEPRLRNLADPFQLPNMAAAADAVMAALRGGKRIVLYGDYDVDGITSCALLSRVLKKLGGHAGIFLPNRIDEGYGLSADGVERCLATHQPNLLIAVDCGTSSANEILRLAGAGVQSIVLDHHLPPAAEAQQQNGRMREGEKTNALLPPFPHFPILNFPALALVNPKFGVPDAPWRHLASVGIAFKLCHALLKRAKDTGWRAADAVDLREYLDLVAVGTIGDVVPLIGENRILAKTGLEQLGRTINPGLRALMKISQVPDKPDPHHVGFRIGPRLNAAGRLRDAMDALEALITDDASRAEVLAETLDQRNRQRQGIEAQTLEEAQQMVEQDFDFQNDRVIVVARDGWHIGVVGIVAARLAQQYYRPAVVIGIADGVGKGSCRSIEGFHIVGALRQCGDLMERFGGHEMAAGLTVRAANVDELRTRLNEAARAMIRADDLFRPIRVEGLVHLGEIDAALLDALGKLAPFGASNPSPLLGALKLRCCATPRAVGRNGEHLKLCFADETGTADAIGFNMAANGVPDGDLDVAFQPEWNEFNGRRQIQLKLKAIRKSASNDTPDS